MRKRITAFVMLLCVIGLLVGAGETVSAETAPKKNEFAGDVGLLKQDGSNYVMQVTVKGSGEDFTGTVQVVFASNYENCAYNTEITLPAQGEKQFTITVPERAADVVRGMCALNFIDEHGKLLHTVSLKNVFGNAVTGVPVGILSDNYPGLTYLDAGGADFYLQGVNLPLQLIELDADNLQGYLNGLYFLVIDQFDVSSLGEESIHAIQDWVKGGGWLVIGTGAYAEQTLSGFDEDFLGVDLMGISEPGEENKVSMNAGRSGYYYNYQDSGVDFTQMAIAEVNYMNAKPQSGNFYESTENPAICGSFDDGAVSILSFSFGEAELQKASDYTIQYIYEETMYNSGSYQSYNGGSDMEYVGQRALAVIDNRNTNLDFTWLKVLIGVYVVLVGPVLYLILRQCKRSEWYWVCAPVLGLLCIAGVYVFGRGAQLNETKVYSVTAQAAGSSQADTYFLAYRSGVKPWSMRLKDNYEVAGPGWCGYYGYSSGSAGDYHYMVSTDSEGMSVGIKPTSNFENAFLYASGKLESKGTITADALKGSGTAGKLEGTVTNGTTNDFAYMSVMFDSYIMVFSDVRAGEALDIAQAVKDGRCVYQAPVAYYENLLYDMVSAYGPAASVAYEQDDAAALLAGIGIAENNKPLDGDYASLIGVVRDFDKAVASKCDEISYGCIYSYAGLEVENHAAD